MTAPVQHHRASNRSPRPPGAAALNTEREAKLIAPSDLRLPDLDELTKGATAVPLAVRQLDATYYDTAELRLARWGITLRYRTGEPGRPWTLKLPDSLAGPALVRRELRFDGGADTVPDAAFDLVRAYVRTHPLTRVARLVTTRTPTEIRRRDGRRLGEIVDDVVYVHQDCRQTGQFREVEVEIDVSAGPRVGRKVLHAAVNRLVAAGCQPGASIPKLVRALGQRAAEPPDVVAPTLDHAALVDVLIGHALARSVLQLLHHDPGVRLGEDPEDVHQLRVGTRKLRSELRTFKPLLDDAPVRSLRAELKWLGTAVGAVRDIDVLTDRLRSESQTLTSADAPAAAQLLALLDRQRRQARRSMLAALRSARYLELLDNLITATTKPPLAPGRPGPGEQPAGEIVSALVRRPWRRLAAAVKGLDQNPSDPALHHVRILAKRCRYAADAIAPVIGRPASRFAAAMADVQTVLGDHQDTVVFEAWLRHAVTVAPATGIVAGQLIARLLDQRARLRATWPRTWKRASKRKLRTWL